MKTTLLALALSFAATSALAAPIQWASGSGGNDHYYEVVTAPLDWNAARADAVTRAHLGLQGYLASVTSNSEHNFILSLISGLPAAWLGGTDQNNDGTWTWVDGPEDGQIFFSAGSATGYTRFYPGEPNGGTNENALETGFFGTFWNDRPESTAWAYVVEYGGVNVAPVPLPAGGMMLLTALGVLVLGRRVITR